MRIHKMMAEKTNEKAHRVSRVVHVIGVGRRPTKPVPLNDLTNIAISFP